MYTTADYKDYLYHVKTRHYDSQQGDSAVSESTFTEQEITMLSEKSVSELSENEEPSRNSDTLSMPVHGKVHFSAEPLNMCDNGERIEAIASLTTAATSMEKADYEEFMVGGG